MLQHLEKPPPLLLCQVVDLLMGRYLRPFHHHRDEFLGQQVVQSVAEVTVGIFCKIGKQPFVELLLVQCGLQVDLNAVCLFLKTPHMGGGGQNQRPAEPEMSK